MKAALDTELAVRDYLNEGGKLLVSGKYALYAQAANGAYFYQPERAGSRSAPIRDDPACLPLFNDFLQYWLGAYTYIDDGGTGADGSPYPLAGHRPIHGSPGTLNAPGSAENQDHTGVVPAHVELPAAGGVPVVRAELGPGRLGPPGRRAVRAVRRRLVCVQRAGRRVVQAADPHGRPDRRRDRAAAVPHLLRHRGRLGLHVRRGARGRHRRLDDAAGRQRRTPTTETGDSCPAGWDRRAAPVPGPLPWAGHDVLVDRHHRRLERGHRVLGRLEGVGRRPVRRTPASRSSCRSPTSPTGGPRVWACSSTTCASRRTVPRSPRDLVRDGPRRLDGAGPAGGLGARTSPTGRAASSASRRAR